MTVSVTPNNPVPPDSESPRPRLTNAVSTPRPMAPSLEPVRWLPLGIAFALIAVLTGYTGWAHGTQQAVLLLLGAGLGLALFHSRFGFTSAWRQLIAVGNGSGLRAHALLLGTTATLFALIIGTGTGLFGNEPQPMAGPIGVGLFVGAFLFGVGMQLGGACASGTLFAVGSGQSTIVVTLGGFIVGSVVYSAIWPLVNDLPELPPFVMSDHIGWAGSWTITVVVLAAVVAGTRVVQNRSTPPPVGAVPSASGMVRAVRGSWPMLVGALVLAVLGGAVLLVSGGGWGITSAFNLWGAKFLQLVGLRPETWAFWQQPDMAEQLSSPVLTHKTSLTDIGIILGAAVAAASAGAWKLHTGLRWRTVVGALIGGILMGIGARLAAGCNIGAYLAGIASGSLHGWLWAVAALVGTWVGLRARPLFGLAVPKPGDSSC
ncbi:YeeE/YedE family protein [Halostreptopolyspora alba]|uniref:YeeE/YedE family protein n=1 Tax=Halostreptopolyspora alba TaxID=2487137 RepID=A0A3N0E3W0_9ACTN|nr:YeeE/YedE family protein [Nocardiopsaceae bacterium YIM 96095]